MLGFAGLSEQSVWSRKEATMRKLVVAMGLLTLASVAWAGSKEDMAAIAELREMEATSAKEGTPEKALEIFADNVKYMPPGEPMVVGADAVRTWLVGLLEQFDLEIEYTYSDATVQGDWAYEHYEANVTMTPMTGGDTMNDQVRGIHIYQRGKDGSWKMTHDIWNSSQPPSVH